MKIISIILASLITTITIAQIQLIENPLSFEKKQKRDKVNTINFKFEKFINNNLNDSVYKVGESENVSINFLKSASLIHEDEKNQIYQLKINVDNVIGIGLTFEKFILSRNAKVFVHNDNATLGAYTEKNNVSELFAIQPLLGQTITIELNCPKNEIELCHLKIKRIGKIIKPIFDDINEKVGECFESIHCVSNLEVERSVMKWLYYVESENSYYTCSCALVNQNVSSNEVKPYVLTANHCGKNAELSTALFYFNWQNSTCDSDNGSQYNYTMEGASFRSKRAVFDMFLMELNSFPPPDYNVHLAGWDRRNRGDLPDEVMGIHHPSGLKKSVSLGSFKANNNPNFWRIEWDRNDSPTEKGSSGSPLFEDDTDRIIGFLSYGASKCSNKDGIDKYGKFRSAWSSVYASDTKLETWLDPLDYEPTAIDGRDPCFTNLLVDNRTFYSAQNRYQPENKVTIQSGNTLTTQNTVVIKSGSEHKFTAGSGLTFNPGFQVESGANFQTSIEGCDIIAKSYQNTSVNNSESENLDYTNFTLNIFPNPFLKEFNVNFVLPSPQPVSLELLDLNGKILMTFFKESNFEKGEYVERVSVDDFSSGVYMIQFTTEKECKRILIIKN